MKGWSFLDPSAFEVKAYVNLIFFPLTPDCLWSNRHLLGASYVLESAKYSESKKRCICTEKACFIHIEDVMQLITILLNKLLNSLPLLLHSDGMSWCCFTMSLDFFQAISLFKAAYSTIAQLQPFIFGNSNQVSKCIPFLMKNLPSKQNSISHCFQNPEVHHLWNFRVFSLSNLFCCAVTVVCFFPLFMPFGFVLDPGWKQWLFDHKVGIDGCKMICCCGLFSAILVVSIKDLNPLSWCCILFLCENRSRRLSGLLFRFFRLPLMLRTCSWNSNNVLLACRMYICFYLFPATCAKFPPHSCSFLTMALPPSSSLASSLS